MTKWYSVKEAPNYEEWILTEWYDGDDGGLKYEADYLYSERLCKEKQHHKVVLY